MYLYARISIFPLSTICLLNFGTVPTVLYCFFLISLYLKRNMYIFINFYNVVPFKQNTDQSYLDIILTPYHHTVVQNIRFDNRN